MTRTRFTRCDPDNSRQRRGNPVDEGPPPYLEVSQPPDVTRPAAPLKRAPLLVNRTRYEHVSLAQSGKRVFEPLPQRPTEPSALRRGKPDLVHALTDDLRKNSGHGVAQQHFARATDYQRGGRHRVGKLHQPVIQKRQPRLARKGHAVAVSVPKQTRQAGEREGLI